MIRARVAAGLVFAAMAAGGFPLVSTSLMPLAAAQNIGQRTVTGSVVDADAALINGATVFLRNTKTKSIRSYTTTKDGRFRFAQVNMSEDYDLWAEKDGKKSAPKTVSSWDARKAFETELRIK